MTAIIYNESCPIQDNGISCVNIKTCNYGKIRLSSTAIHQNIELINAI